MNPVAGSIMIAIAAAFFGLMYFAVAYGHPWLLAALVISVIAAFVRWG
ncbi:DUF4175 domain-containing protein [Methylobacterium soli]|uniref:DUF4175 domain-containing protein n=1 Tax=Methylobacterium soli TaxID=553447 RepID=A0A6L3SR44_9HYPH|nr:DUF4175 domain-containing protein [Methylobacterium soli]KAB1072878.1 DUF4175 domain-containing protein [Methylobacterium soli]